MDEMKSIALEILKDVAAFCDANSIRYYLAYGTMLGAVRHSGFIPWDDDIDIMMPRKDYEKFIEHYNNINKYYRVCSIDNDYEYPYTMAKVFDLRTEMIDLTHRKQYKYAGVFIDIFPVDGLPDDKNLQTSMFNYQQFLNILIHGSCMDYTVSQHYADSKERYAKLKGILRTLMKFVAVTLMHPLPTSRLIKKINENAKKISFDQANMVSVLIDCESGNKREVWPREIFDNVCDYPFEQYCFKGIKDYDFYLTQCFNNYMEMPPKDRRVPHHNFEVYFR